MYEWVEIDFWDLRYTSCFTIWVDGIQDFYVFNTSQKFSCSCIYKSLELSQHKGELLGSHIFHSFRNINWMLITSQIWSKSYACIISVTPLDNPMRQILLLLSFLAEDAKTQRNLPVIDLLKVRQEVADSGLRPGHPWLLSLLSLIQRRSLVTKQPGVIT